MTLEAFQQNKNLVRAALDLATKHETFKIMFDVVKEHSPLRTPLYGAGASPSDHSYRLGLVEGYHMAVKTLEATWALPVKPRKEIVATYPDPE